MTGSEIVARYRHLRALANRIQRDALDRVSSRNLLEQGRALGLADGHRWLTDTDDEMAIVCDMAVYSRRQGGSRAIDRHAAMMDAEPGSDEAHVIAAFQAARFSIWRIERRHAEAGLVVLDVLRGGETWLMDLNLAATAGFGSCFAGRLLRPEDFAMSCGVLVPVDAEILSDTMDEFATWRRVDD